LVCEFVQVPKGSQYALEQALPLFYKALLVQAEETIAMGDQECSLVVELGPFLHAPSLSFHLFPAPRQFSATILILTDATILARFDDWTICILTLEDCQWKKFLAHNAELDLNPAVSYLPYSILTDSAHRIAPTNNDSCLVLVVLS